MMHAIVYGHIDTFNNDKDDLRSATKEGTRKKAADDRMTAIVKEYLPFKVKKQKNSYIYIYIYVLKKKK